MSEEEVSRPEYEELPDGSGEAASGDAVDAGKIDEVEVRLVASIGNCEMSLKDVTALKEGERLILDKTVDAPVDLTVDGRVVGQGEIVVVDDRFGIRILSMAEKHGG